VGNAFSMEHGNPNPRRSGMSEEILSPNNVTDTINSCSNDVEGSINHPNDGAGNSDSKSSKHIPVLYRISWTNLHTFTITLLVPRVEHGENQRNTNSNELNSHDFNGKSPFQKVVQEGSNNSVETHVLRVSLTYLRNLSSGGADQLDLSPWLDRPTLRNRLCDGGRAVGLETQHLHDAVTAVEETAMRLPQWFPDGTESVNAEIALSEGHATLVARVIPMPESSFPLYSEPYQFQTISFEQQQKQQYLQQRISMNQNSPPKSTMMKPNVLSPNSNNLYNQPSSLGLLSRRNSMTMDSVLDETSGALLATAPSFSPSRPLHHGESSFVSLSEAASRNHPDSAIRSVSEGRISDALFGKSRSSKVPVPESSEAHFGKSREVWQESGQKFELSNQYISTPSDGAQYGGISTFYAADSNSDPDGVVGYESFRKNLSSSSTQDINIKNEHNTTNNQIRPDPSTIVKPLLELGFNRRECEAAVNAIRKLSLSSSDDPGMHNYFGKKTDNQKGNQQFLNQQQTQQMQLVSHKESKDKGSINNDCGHQDDAQQEDNTSDTNRNQNAENLSGKNIMLYALNDDGANKTHQNVLQEDILNSFSTAEGKPNSLRTQAEKSSAQDAWGTGKLQTGNQKPFTVWGNAGKLRLVKSSSGGEGSVALPDVVNGRIGETGPFTESSLPAPGRSGSVKDSPWSTSSQQTSQRQKIVKVLELPAELNAFVFHCNAQTREECLERRLFGCPSGGQYGPHSNAKKGDLLFLADFSAWTVTGIFTAECDASLNLEKSAWGGRFPWQIRLTSWTDLRTVHIDKVNEIIGLASGSKLNMLTKQQLLHLVTSKEFGPCVPPHLYKTKAEEEKVSDTVPTQPNISTQHLAVVDTSNETERLTSSVSLETKKINVKLEVTRTVPGENVVKNQRDHSLLFIHDEHPATAMHRLKLITAWFDTFTGEMLNLNEIYNKKKVSKKIILDDVLSEVLRKKDSEPWPLMNYNHIRAAIANLFDQWLFQVHAIGNSEQAGNRQFNQKGENNPHSIPESGSWTRQQARSNFNGKIREDPVLLSNTPGILEYIQNLFQIRTGITVLRIPSHELAEVLALKFINEIEQISIEVCKTQGSLIRIGGDDYLKSVEDKALGMRLGEVKTKFYNKEGVKIEKPIIRIEWHTKSSIAQGRPPQVQKIYRTHFEMLEKKYKDVAAASDPSMAHVLRRMFVLLCRYDLIGDITSGCQALVPPMALKSMSQHFGVIHECFASPMSRICSSYNSLFPDVDRYFGSLGSFFDFLPLEGSFEVNPPFSGFSLKMVFDHILSLLQNSDNDKNALSFLVILKETKEALQQVNESQFLRRVATIESNVRSMMGGLYHKDTISASRKLTKTNEDANSFDYLGPQHPSNSGTLLIWLQNDFGHDLWTPSEEKVQTLIERFQ